MGDCRLILGDCLDVLPALAGIDAVVSDPPYGMKNRTHSGRFTGGKRALLRGGGREWPEVIGDDVPFDPTPWLDFPRVVLWGANHFGARLQRGTTLLWVKRADHHFGTFLSDAEVAWMKGGHGVYCYRVGVGAGAPSSARLHPNQKPVALMRWCVERLKLPPGATILDPYMGSGSTGVAALQLGYRFVGVEKSPTCFAAAERRIAEARLAAEAARA